MNVLYLILLVLGAACFLLAAFSVTLHPRISLIAAGLFFWILVPLIQLVDAM